jgi:HAD superfamily hydrolase (TIGR01484 family)
MRYFALVVDYDGTLAVDGQVAARTASALERVRESGRRMILITGRVLDELFAICSCLQFFDCVVAENGALYYVPATHETIPLAQPPAERFIKALQQRGVDPLSIGRIIVSTTIANKAKVFDAVHEIGREQHIIFNKGMMMTLPSGVSKATGMAYALRKMGLSPHEAVGVGDAENDYSFLDLCECSAAVANATDSIKELVSFTTRSEAGDGVVEVIDELVANDLRNVDNKRPQHALRLGDRRDGSPVWIPAYGQNVLIAGPSGCGKSSLAAGLMERLAQQHYQVCIIDPEGDYRTLQDGVALGNEQRSPNANEILGVLEDPQINVAVNLLGIPLADRPYFFVQLLPSLQAMRARTGRPHWLLIDEAHHMLPTASALVPLALPQTLGGTILITVHPDQVAPSIVSFIDVVIAVGTRPCDTLANFSAAIGRPPPLRPSDLSATSGEVVTWFVQGDNAPFPMQVIPTRSERIRHHRKYAKGNLRYSSFFFRGPSDKQNLMAQNLMVFSQIAEGIDEETWLFHLYRGDYARWFRNVIRDPQLADVATEVQQRKGLLPREARRLICEAIKARYTLPER